MVSFFFYFFLLIYKNKNNEFYKKLSKKIMLGTSDAWSTSHLSQRTSVLYCRLSNFNTADIICREVKPNWVLSPVRQNPTQFLVWVRFSESEIGLCQVRLASNVSKFRFNQKFYLINPNESKILQCWLGAREKIEAWLLFFYIMTPHLKRAC